MTPTRFLATIVAAGAFLLLASACFEASVEEGEGGAAPRAISVSGAGEVRAEPDVATVSTGVEVNAPTVAEARAGAARAASAVVAVLRAGGVAEADIRTVNFSIYPMYDYRDDTPRIIGYVVSNTVEVTVRNIETIGELIDAVAAAGGDAVRFGGISFAHEDPGELTQQARELAIADARAKAEQIAELTGVALGELLSVTETSWAAPLVAGRAEFAMADSAATSIQPGTSGVNVTVQVSWAIADEEE